MESFKYILEFYDKFIDVFSSYLNLMDTVKCTIYEYINPNAIRKTISVFVE